jgi:hypothetical protein
MGVYEVHRTVLGHGPVELLEIEARPELALGLLAERHDLEAARVVRGELSRPHRDASQPSWTAIRSLAQAGTPLST